MVEVNLNCESDNRPSKFLVENIINNKCDIVLFENIKKNTRQVFSEEKPEEEDQIYYSYDMFRITDTNYREELELELADPANYRMWLKFAKEKYASQIIEIPDNERIAALEQAIIDIGEVIGNG